MSQSLDLDQLATALCAAQAEFTAIPKDSTNPFFKSKFAGLPKVVEVASPILSKHGLAVSQFIGADERGDLLTTWLLHKSGQFISESMRLHLVDSKGNPRNDPQGQGSATTYARRYSYMSVLGLVADEDDDGNAGSSRAQQKQPSRVPRIEPDVVEACEAAMRGLGWKVGEVRTQLAAHGAQDVSDVKVALRSLSREQGDRLWSEIQNAVAA